MNETKCMTRRQTSQSKRQKSQSKRQMDPKTNRRTDNGRAKWQRDVTEWMERGQDDVREEGETGEMEGKMDRCMA